ncbi:MAG: Hpt domain-containing protein, partial [Chlorobiota bacterium]
PILEKLSTLHDEKNWDEMKKVAHKFKPTLSYVGIKELEGVVPQLEKYALDQDPNGNIPELIETLNYFCSEALDEIRRHFGETTENEGQ